jgi:hypothetical protein
LAALLWKLTGFLRGVNILESGGRRPAGWVSRFLKLLAGWFATGYRGGGPPAPLLFFWLSKLWLHGSVHAWSHDLLGLQASLRPANYFPFTVVMLQQAQCHFKLLCSKQSLQIILL